MVSESPQHRCGRMSLILVQIYIYEALLWRAGCDSIMGVHLRTYVRLQVFHYATPGPVALRLDWNNISITFSGKLNLDGSAVKSHISLMCF